VNAGPPVGGRSFHRPVLVEELLGHLESAREGEIMDGTVGGGGHSGALLERYPQCRVVAVDRDPEAISVARLALAAYQDRVRFIEAPFDVAAATLAGKGPHLSGALLDLGVSTHQLDRDERGFSFRGDAPLDMRMSGGTSGDRTAADLLNTLQAPELERIFRDYGELPQWRRLAGAVVLLRRDRPFATSEHLVEALAKALRRTPSPQEKAKAFQALRLEVNREIPSLERALPHLRDALLPGGVVSVIAYESLSDRVVKHAFRDWSESCVCPPDLPVCACDRIALGAPVNRKAVRPTAAEVEENSRARSARLRSWRKAA
jgi:16S rRNA (cytosine1402-N4)-methyltransferase